MYKEVIRYDAAFKLRTAMIVSWWSNNRLHYILTLPSSSSRPRIVAAGPCRQKQIVAAAFERGSTVFTFGSKFVFVWLFKTKWKNCPEGRGGSRGSSQGAREPPPLLCSLALLQLTFWLVQALWLVSSLDLEFLLLFKISLQKSEFCSTMWLIKGAWL